MTGDVTSDVGGVKALIRAQEEFVVAARHFRAERSWRATVALLPLGLAEEELPGRVLRMVAAGVVRVVVP